MGKAKWFFSNIEVILGVTATILMVIVMFIQVISRYVFAYSIPWTEEVVIICFVLSTYAGCSLAVMKDKHLTIDILIFYLPHKWKKVFGITANICFILFCLYIVNPLIQITSRLYKGGTKYIITGIPQYVIYSLVIFFLILTVVRLVQKSIDLYKQEEGNKANNAILDLDNLT